MSSLAIPYITFEIWLLINRECRNYTRLSGQLTRRTSCLYYPGLGLQAMYYPDQVFMRVLGINPGFCAYKQTFPNQAIPRRFVILCVQNLLPDIVTIMGMGHV